jgi:hypothetical protein
MASPEVELMPDTGEASPPRKLVRLGSADLGLRLVLVAPAPAWSNLL